MILSDVSVKRPIFAGVLSALLIAFGILSYNTLPLRELPDIDPPEVSIDVDYRGASAEVVETRVTDVIESQLNGIEGVETITSSSVDGEADIELEFALDRDLDQAANDVRDAVARALPSLPEEIEPPRVRKANANARPIMWFNLSSPTLDPLELTDFGDRVVVDRFAVVDGVARVFLGGEQMFSMRIWLDRLALAARGLTPLDVEQALRSQNVELPAGRVEGQDRDFIVRVERSYTTPADFQNLVIAEGPGGQLVRLSDVARVEVGPEERRNAFNGNGDPMIGVGIVAKSKSNLLEVARGAKQAAEDLRRTLPADINLYDSFDSSVFVEEAIQEVWRTLAIAVALVILVIYLFLGNIRAALVPSIVVPVCLTATFIAIAAFGFSINLITLLALILAIGLVVDDSIVVLENIQRRVDEGESRLVASFLGARQVGFAVIATTLVLISVFAALAFLEGFVGRLFRELALTISAAVAFSSLVALTLSPMMCSKLLASRASFHAQGKRRRNIISRTFLGGVERASGAYQQSLAMTVNRPATAFGILTGLAGFAGLLVWLLPNDLAPQEDRGAFFVFMQTAEGSGFDYTLEQVRKAEDVLLEYAPEEEGGNGEAQRVLVRVPGFGSAGSFNTGIAIVVLTPWSERERDDQTIIDEVQGRLNQIPGLFARVGARSPIGRTDGSGQVGFVLLGSDYDAIDDWAETVIARANQWEGFAFARKDFEPTSRRLNVAVDRNRAADLGVSVEDIGRTLEAMTGSRRAGTYVNEGEEYDVLVQAELEDRRSFTDLSNIFVRAREGGLVPLSNLVALEPYADSSERPHFNRSRSITISANLNPGFTQGDAIEFLEQVVAEELPPEARFDYTAGTRQYLKSSNAFAFIFVLALVVVFLVLAAQFESLIHPFVIMLTVPVAALGGLFGIYATGGSINIYTQIGLLMLVGLSAKNGILIVEFANQLRDQGQSVKDAIMEASRIRFRPVIMTGISTAMGALPLMLSEGAGAESRAAIGTVVVIGTLFGTLLTLYVVPIFYNAFAGYTRSPGRIARLLNQELKSTKGTSEPGTAEPAGA